MGNSVRYLEQLPARARDRRNAYRHVSKSQFKDIDLILQSILQGFSLKGFHLKVAFPSGLNYKEVC